MGAWWRKAAGAVGLALVSLQLGCQSMAPIRLGADLTSSLAMGAMTGGYEAPIPPNFLWGVSTAGHQSEGGDTTSNWAEWGQAGRFKEVAGKSVDFWNRYEEDFRLARSMGCTSFRMSIEWSRIEPRKGVFDEAAVAHYRAMLASMRANGMEPVLTLSHWVMPAWVDDDGGWTNKDTVYRFMRFVDKVTTDVAPNARMWITFNEPNLWLPRDYLLGMMPPGKKGPINFARAARNVIRAHALAYDRLHEQIPGAMVSTNIYQIMFGKGKPGVQPQANDTSWVDQNWFYDALTTGQLPGEMDPGERSWQVDIMGKIDYVAFDYYWTFASINDVLHVAEPWGLGYDPDRLETTLLDYQRQYGKPIFIAENGMCTNDLQPRKDGWTREGALDATVKAMRRAMGRGAQVIGYSHWSLTDNYEWGTFSPRFGLYSVDCRHDPSLKRIPTPAVDAYRRIITGVGAVPPVASSPSSVQAAARSLVAARK